MRQIILICDRCGKQYNAWTYKSKELYGIAEIDYSDYEPILDIKLDLCEECYHSFEKWLNNPEIVATEKWARDPDPTDNHRERSFA